MPRQQVEFDFPDPDEEARAAAEIEVALDEEDNDTLEVEAAVGREDMKKPGKDGGTIKAGDLEIEVEDDTPPEDRGKEASPPEDVTDDELQSYGKKVQKRLKALSKTYHDERRAKEAAMREREALEQYARQLVEENQQLKNKTDESHNALIESARKQVASELAVAQQKYKQAYESGESDAIIEAQQLLNTAQIRADKVNSLKLKITPAKENITLQKQENIVQSQAVAPPQPTIQRDEKAVKWADENTWFGDGPEGDPEMTAFAYGLHTKLVNEGVDPRSDEYYERIDSRMRQVFPEQFDDGEDEPEVPQKKSSNVVAPATRSTAPKKIRLTQSQITIAKKLGVSLEDYAKQQAALMRKQ